RTHDLAAVELQGFIVRERFDVRILGQRAGNGRKRRLAGGFGGGLGRNGGSRFPARGQRPGQRLSQGRPPERGRDAQQQRRQDRDDAFQARAAVGAGLDLAAQFGRQV